MTIESRSDNTSFVVLPPIRDQIRDIAKVHADALKKQIDTRVDAMLQDDTSHFLIYRVLGISDEEGRLIDSYQNKGRFLYKYAGSFLEQAAKLCFKSTYPNAGSLRIANTSGSRPKTFEIDCVIDKDAHEIKWRDATTDGDHITKEHTRIRVIKDAGYVPIRVMFYYPNREQAIRVQKTLETCTKVSAEPITTATRLGST
jgi:ApaLI-like restriction endonuclease